VAKPKKTKKPDPAGDDKTPAGNVVAERYVASHPHALAARGRKLVPDALACDLPLELGKGQENVEG
jgi:hypothetical protein